MIEIKRKDGSWVRFSCPEWNYLTAERQQEIIRNLQNSTENIIPFPKRVRSQGELKQP